MAKLNSLEEAIAKVDAEIERLSDVRNRLTDLRTVAPPPKPRKPRGPNKKRGLPAEQSNG